MPIQIPNLVPPSSERLALPPLDLSLTPFACRDAERIDRNHCKSLLRDTAIRIYCHEKVTKFWAKNCRNGENKLLWFINRIDVERQKTANRRERTLFGYGVTKSSGSFTSIDKPLALDSNTRIASTALVDLALFEDLWYMVCARVRELYSDLNVRFQNGFITAETVLHNFGSEGTSFGLWRSKDMVKLLQEHWSILMDKHLIATLDHAVRKRNHELLIATLNPKYFFEDNHVRESVELQERCEAEPYPVSGMITADDVAGLENINQMPIADFVLRVWWKVGPMVEKESIEEKRNEQLRMMARSQVNRRKHFNDLAEEALPNCVKLDDGTIIGAMGCECRVDCHCKSICGSDPWDHCFCKSNPLFLQYLQQNDTEKLVRDLLAKTCGQLSGTEHLFDAPSNSVAQLQVATAALDYDETMIGATTGLRSAIENMQNAYVARRLEYEGTRVPKTPNKQKKVKDVYPLDFYNESEFFAKTSSSARYDSTIDAPLTPPMSREFRTDETIASDSFADVPLQPAPLTWRKSSTLKPKSESSTTYAKGCQTPENFAPVHEASPTITPPRPLHNRRYVLAGGNTPLKFRPEVSWGMKPPVTEGLKADKEQLFNALSETSSIEPSTAEADKSRSRKVESSPSQSSIDSFDNKDNFGKKRIFVGLKGEVRKLFRRGSNQ